MAEVVTEPAPAKINPVLRVLARRPDGYHEVETLIVPITLADGVQVVAGDELVLTVTGERAADVPPGEDNLALRAAIALRRYTGVTAGARILLSKRIPVAAGLGGGSADAAAALRALNRLWGCGLDEEGLREVGLSVGSDVPALVGRGSMLVRGRGEAVEQVELPKTWWVLVTSDAGVPAEDAYAWWDGAPMSDAEPGVFVGAIRDGDLERAGRLLSNDLQPGVERRRADVVQAREAFLEAGALGAVMSGSGPSVVALAKDADDAERLASEVGGLVVASMHTR